MHTHKVILALLASLALVSASPKNYGGCMPQMLWTAHGTSMCVTVTGPDLTITPLYAAACPDSCNQSPTCHCGSTKPPGGLAPSEVPQFIVLTNDDSGAQHTP